MGNQHLANIWNARVIDGAIRSLRLMKITRFQGKVELHSPLRPCSRCKHNSAILISPSRLCPPCWSHTIISKWKVPRARIRRDQ